MKNRGKNTIWYGRAALITVFCLCFVITLTAQVANAIDSDSLGDFGNDDQESNFANPAQARHAANLAEAAASEPDQATLDALGAVEDAESALEAAKVTGVEEDIAAAEKNLAEAQEAYAAAVEAHTGVLASEITGMREEGMGWGEIAHELGVHPSVLGLGHTKEKNKNGFADEQDFDDSEIGEATARNSRSGWSKGHGVGLDTGVGNPGTAHAGLALGKDKGKTGGISGASGLSGKGNSGNGGGKGGGVGNGGGKGVAGSDGSPGNSGGGKGAGNSGNGAEGGGHGGKGKGGGKGGK